MLHSRSDLSFIQAGERELLESFCTAALHRGKREGHPLERCTSKLAKSYFISSVITQGASRETFRLFKPLLGHNI